MTIQEKSIDFATIKQLTHAESKVVDQLILNELNSDIALINQIGRYIVGNGGKRLRPMLLLLVAKALDYRGDKHLMLAAIIEFIHTATLLHDDVVDESDLRRGQESSNIMWGNAASVLVGDYLYSKSFEMMVRVNDIQIMNILAKTTSAIAEGEVMQLLNCNNLAISKQEYLKVISRKTAILFSASTRLSCVIAKADSHVEKQLVAYGQHIGISFQLIDDALDYKSNIKILGKNVGSDLNEGKLTMPLIYTLQVSNKADTQTIINSIKNNNQNSFNEIQAIVKASGAIAYTEKIAQEEAQKAIASLSVLASSKYKDAMIMLAKFAVERCH